MAWEPVLFIDTTASENYHSDYNDPTPRHIPLMTAVQSFVTAVSEEDAAASTAANTGEAEEEGGGVLTYTFAGGHFKRLGDLNPDNFSTKTRDIQWAGGTFVMPAIGAWQTDFREEFGTKDAPKKEEYPNPCLLIATDGGLEDEDRLIAWISNYTDPLRVAFILQGRGNDNANMLPSYQELAKRDSRIQVYSVQGNTDPNAMAKAFHLALMD
jgi:hypothetical protein